MVCQFLTTWATPLDPIGDPQHLGISRTLPPDATMEELRIDSLGMMSLSLAIEERMDIPMEEVTRENLNTLTLAELGELVNQIAQERLA